MPSLYIAEYEQIVDTTVGKAIAPQAPPHQEQKLSIAVGATPSAPFHPRTRFVRLNTDAACSIAFAAVGAADPVATIANQRLAPNQTEYFGVFAGTKMSVISNT